MKEIIICAVIIAVLIVVAIPLFMFKREEVNETGFGPLSHTERPYQWIATMLVIFAIGMSIALPIYYEQKMDVKSNILALQEEIDSLNVILDNEENQTNREKIYQLITKKEEELTKYEK